MHTYVYIHICIHIYIHMYIYIYIYTHIHTHTYTSLTTRSEVKKAPRPAFVMVSKPAEEKIEGCKTKAINGRNRREKTRKEKEEEVRQKAQTHEPRPEGGEQKAGNRRRGTRRRTSSNACSNGGVFPRARSKRIVTKQHGKHNDLRNRLNTARDETLKKNIQIE